MKKFNNFFYNIALIYMGSLLAGVESCEKTFLRSKKIDEGLTKPTDTTDIKAEDSSVDGQQTFKPQNKRKKGFEKKHNNINTKKKSRTQNVNLKKNEADHSSNPNVDLIIIKNVLNFISLSGLLTTERLKQIKCQATDPDYHQLNNLIASIAKIENSTPLTDDDVNLLLEMWPDMKDFSGTQNYLMHVWYAKIMYFINEKSCDLLDEIKVSCDLITEVCPNCSRWTRMNLAKKELNLSLTGFSGTDTVDLQKYFKSPDITMPCYCSSLVNLKVKEFKMELPKKLIITLLDHIVDFCANKDTPLELINSSGKVATYRLKCALSDYLIGNKEKNPQSVLFNRNNKWAVYNEELIKKSHNSNKFSGVRILYYEAE